MRCAVEMFHEQAEGLKEGGADVLWVETISAAERISAPPPKAARAGRHALVRHDELRHRRAHHDGADLGRAGRAWSRRWPNPPIAFGANCGVGASDLMRTVLGFAAQGTERPVIAKGNAGIPKYVEGHIHYDGTPGADGGICGDGARRRGADHRRLLRHHARASAAP